MNSSTPEARGRRVFRAAFLLGAVLLSASPALSTPATPVTVWRSYQQQPGGATGDARASRLLADGSLLVAFVDRASLTMTRFDASGNVLTRFAAIGAGFADSNSSTGRSAVASATGEVYVSSGSSGTSYGGGGSAITKWDAYTGLRLWPGSVLVDEIGASQTLALEPNGDVVFAGAARWGSGFVVTRLARFSGEVIVPPVLLAADYMNFSGIQIDPSGDLIATGSYTGSVWGSVGYRVGKLSLTTGLEVWGPLDFSSRPAVRCTPSGDVVVWAGARVTRYSGATGRAIWSQPAVVLPADATAMELDGAGDVYTAAQGTAGSLFTRFDGASGATVWSHPGGADSGLAMVVDGAGDVIAFGSGMSKFAHDSGDRVFGPVAAFYPGQKLLLDPSGDVFSIGTAGNSVKAARYAGSSGSAVWGPAPATTSAFSSDSWRTAAVDGAGDVLVATLSAVTKVSGQTGETVWGPASLLSADTLASDKLLPTPSGDVIVAAGTSPYSSAPLTRIWKFAGGDGALAWGPVSLGGLFVSAALDAAGDLFVLRRETSSSSSRISISKLSGASGATSWSVLWSCGTDGNRGPTALRVDAAGNAIVAGLVDGNAGVVLSFSAATGAVLWGPVYLQDFSPSVGNVLLERAGGSLLVTTLASGGSWSGYPVQLRKVDPATGAVLWGPFAPLLRSPGSTPWSQGMDSAGDLLVTFGGSDYGTTPSRTVAKIRGADGGTAWSTLILSNTYTGDQLAVDAGGDLAILGGRSYSYVTLKIDRVSGADGSLLWSQITSASPICLAQPDILLLRGRDLVLAGADANVSAATRITGGLVIQPPPDGSLTAGCGQPFVFDLAATNGTEPYSFDIVSGALPAGLTLSSAGRIAGTASGDGAFPVRVRVTDANAAVAERDFVLSVVDGQTYVAIGASPAAPCDGDTVTLSVPGTWSAYEWLPGGEGTPTVDVTLNQPSTFAVLVTDAGGCRRRGVLTLVPRPVTSAPTIATPAYVAANTSGLVASAAAHAGSTYAWSVTGGTITAGQGTAAITWSSGPPGPVAISVRETAGGACPSPLATVSVTAERQVASRFQPIAPCRVLDTREAAGPRGGPSLAAGATRLVLVAGTCGVPADALALAANVTPVVPAAAGDLLVGPGDQPLGPLPLLPGRTRAVSMLLGLATDGSGTVLFSNASAGKVDVLLDVSGYFR